MASFEFAGLSAETATRNKAAFDQLIERYRTDPGFRADVDANPEARLREVGFVFPPGAQVRLVADTDQVRHIVMPSDPNVELSDEALEMVSGGSSLSSAGTAGTLSTALTTCMVSTAGTASCASTAASN